MPTLRQIQMPSGSATDPVQGSVAVYATDGGSQLSLDVGMHFVRNIRYQFLQLYTMGSDAIAAAVADVSAALRDGALPVGRDAGLPITRFPLEQTAAAHDAVAGGLIGKALIDVGA